MSADPPEAERPRERAGSAGSDLARQLLAQARAAARRRSGARPAAGSGAAGPGGAAAGAAPRADDRDPARLGAAVARPGRRPGLGRHVGRRRECWARWEQIVGPGAGRALPPGAARRRRAVWWRSRPRGRPRSGCWPGQLVARISTELGPGVVRGVRVHGPTAPSTGSAGRCGCPAGGRATPTADRVAEPPARLRAAGSAWGDQHPGRFARHAGPQGAANPPFLLLPR